MSWRATTKIGYPVEAIRPIGVIALVCTILYAVPRTALLGAILLTGFYGGSVASKIRIEDPLFGSILFGVTSASLSGVDSICGMSDCALSSLSDVN